LKIETEIEIFIEKHEELMKNLAEVCNILGCIEERKIEDEY
jgi:hypothetical protein